MGNQMPQGILRNIELTVQSKVSSLLLPMSIGSVIEAGISKTDIALMSQEIHREITDMINRSPVNVTNSLENVHSQNNEENV